GEEVLTRHFGTPNRLMALHATGSGAYKWWPLERFAVLGAYLYQCYRAPLLIISGSWDRARAEALAARLPGPTLVTGGSFPLPMVAAMLKRARLLVANDSGPLHMALALGVPSIALIGADHPARIGPYQVDWGTCMYRKEEVCQEERCLNRRCQENRCMQAITVEEVVRVVEAWWEPRWGGE
ncbi:MAG: glycosyltransferase family 9 protein, partial [Deltaproteobacteria bacterium]|nr:glycosyltransferase family 9 protein [Deltaproteobacteria bacterium]